MLVLVAGIPVIIRLTNLMVLKKQPSNPIHDRHRQPAARKDHREKSHGDHDAEKDLGLGRAGSTAMGLAIQITDAASGANGHR